MTMIFNGAELKEVRFNDVDCEKVYFNGPLVFEKVTGNQYLLTVGTYQWYFGRLDYGLLEWQYAEDGETLVEGGVNPKFIIELGQELDVLFWYGQPGSEYGIELVGKSRNFNYSGLWLLTVGDWEGVLVGFDDGALVWSTYTYPPNGRPFTVDDLNLLPKSGTHIVTLRKIT